MIRGGSPVCYRRVDHRALDSREALVDYLSRMIWMIVTSHALLSWMMLMIPKPGNSISSFCLLFTCVNFKAKSCHS